MLPPVQADLFLPPPEPMVFVDLETTGGRAGADRITEIGIVEVSAQGVTEWNSLVNPQCRIPPFIEQLTGISNAMVRGAPVFAELAAEVLQRLKGRLFIAHNARFDYGFLQSEFQRAGIDFRADVLCTVRLSRKLYPQHRRHNLDSLIERHHLHTDDRHRALGDARLIWQFWQRLQQSHAPAALEKAVAALCARPSLPPQLDPLALDGLPDGHGVYVLYGDDDRPLHIGKSKTLRQRVLSHFSASARSARAQRLAQQVRRINWLETQGELGSLLQEAALTRQLLPSAVQPRSGLGLDPALAPEALADWPYPGAVGLREGTELHVLDAWRHLGTARSDEEAWALLETARPAKDALGVDPAIYALLHKLLPRSRVLLLAAPAGASV